MTSCPGRVVKYGAESAARQCVPGAPGFRAHSRSTGAAARTGWDGRPSASQAACGACSALVPSWCAPPCCFRPDARRKPAIREPSRCPPRTPGKRPPAFRSADGRAWESGCRWNGRRRTPWFLPEPIPSSRRWSVLHYSSKHLAHRANPFRTPVVVNMRLNLVAEMQQHRTQGRVGELPESANGGQLQGFGKLVNETHVGGRALTVRPAGQNIHHLLRAHPAGDALAARFIAE